MYSVHLLSQVGWTLPKGRGIVGYVAETGQALNIEDAYACAHFDPSSDRRQDFVTKYPPTAPRNAICMGDR